LAFHPAILFFLWVKYHSFGASGLLIADPKIRIKWFFGSTLFLAELLLLTYGLLQGCGGDYTDI
jgi:hypothetical protein